MFLPYVYKVTNRFTKEFYIGMRSANKVVAEQDLGISYFTSSKRVKADFANYDVQIIAYFKDQISAFEFENDLIKEHWGDPLLMNRHYQKSMTSFSMAGMKRPDLAELNSKLKAKPKEVRTYKCLECKCKFTVEEPKHRPKARKFCGQKCSSLFNGRIATNAVKGKSLPHLHGRPTWNKGIPNPTAAENARKGAAKLSAKAKGRKRFYNEDGSWTWYYPNP